MIAPITLTSEELESVITRVSPNGKEFGAARICRLLAEEHSVQTVRVNTRCSVGNISDQVSKFVNPRIQDLGLYVTCVKPAYKILNRFGQSSGQMLWSFYRDVAANDPVHTHTVQQLENELRKDLQSMQIDFPHDHLVSTNETASTWMEALSGGDK